MAGGLLITPIAIAQHYPDDDEGFSLPEFKTARVEIITSNIVKIQSFYSPNHSANNNTMYTYNIYDPSTQWLCPTHY